MPTLNEYYDWRMGVAEVCLAMQAKGIAVDRPFIERLEETFEGKKLGLFPYKIVDTKTVTRKCKVCKGKGILKKSEVPCAECVGLGEVEETKSIKPRKMWSGPFNPNSPSKVCAWFASQGIELVDQVGKPAAGKAIVQKKLNKLLKPYGLEFDPKTAELIGEEDYALPEPVETLLRLAQKQCAGKGLKSWFDARYIQNGRVHARFNPCGTSTGRLSSGNPNFQNIPRQGFGKEVRKALIADKGCKCLKADLSQLEFRVCVWLAGLDPSTVDGAFDRLTESGGALFKPAADRNFGGSLRDVAKSAVHACLTPEHEVLTPNGWIKISDWNGERIAQWSLDNNIDFIKPNAYFKYDYDGKLKALESHSLSAVCTDNHAWPVQISGTWNKIIYKKWHRQETSSLSSCGRIPICGSYEPEDCFEISDNDIKRCVAIQADASIWGETSTKARFHIVKDRKKARLKELFPESTQRPCSDHENGVIVSVDLPKVSILDPGSKKNFNLTKILSLPTAQRKIFLEELLEWDGTKSKRGIKTYFSNNLHNVEVVQTVAHLTNQEALVRISPQRGVRNMGYRVQFNRRKFTAVDTIKHYTEDYKGFVYCFTTDTGYFVVRRNHKVYITGNSNYMEGLSLKTAKELEESHIYGDRKAGALLVFDGQDNPLWTFRGKYVTFTGGNLSERLFGDRTRANRKAALAIQEIYFNAYPQIREFQRATLSALEHKPAYLTLSSGHKLMFYNRTDEEDCKQGCAFLGQGNGSVYAQEGMLRFAELGRTANLQVHDELDFMDIPLGMSDETCLDFMRPMVMESKLMKGFSCPAKVKVGPNLGEMREIGEIRV